MRLTIRPHNRLDVMRSITENMLFWYDFADSSTVTLNGTQISAIKDKGPGGYTMTQATQSAQPYYDTMVNGLKAGRGVKALKTRINASGLDVLIPMADVSFFLVYKSSDAWQRWGGPFTSTTFGAPYDFNVSINDKYKIEMGAHSTDTGILDPVAHNTDLSLAEVHVSQDAFWTKTFFNGVQADYVSPGFHTLGTGPNFHFPRLFTNRWGNQSFTGIICEVMCYYGVGAYVGNARRQAIANHLMAKWGI